MNIIDKKSLQRLDSHCSPRLLQPGLYYFFSFVLALSEVITPYDSII